MSINRSLHRIAQEGVIQTLEEKDKEIERLNNIINELEKFIDEEYRYYNKRNYPTFGACMRALNRIKDKLQELKGSNKE